MGVYIRGKSRWSEIHKAQSKGKDRGIREGIGKARTKETKRKGGIYRITRISP